MLQATLTRRAHEAELERCADIIDYHGN